MSRGYPATEALARTDPFPDKRCAEAPTSGRRSHLSRPLSAKRGSDQPQPRAVGLALSVVPVPAAKTRASSCQSPPAAAPATLECADQTRVQSRGRQRAGRTEGWGPGIAPDCSPVYWSIARGQRWSHPAVALRSLPHLGSLSGSRFAQHGLKVFPQGAVGGALVVRKFIVDYILDSPFHT